ncbi:unnamed protein product, partial [Citrullus colocynthis]
KERKREHSLCIHASLPAPAFLLPRARVLAVPASFFLCINAPVAALAFPSFAFAFSVVAPASFFLCVHASVVVLAFPSSAFAFSVAAPASFFLCVHASVAVPISFFRRVHAFSPPSTLFSFFCVRDQTILW